MRDIKKTSRNAGFLLSDLYGRLTLTQALLTAKSDGSGKG